MTRDDDDELDEEREDEDLEDEERAQGFEDVATVQCPYCFEVVELDLDPETEGRLVQDCEVCCNPWQLTITRDDDGRVSVDVDRAQ